MTVRRREASREDRVDEQQVVARIREGIAALNEREKLVVALYYDEELTLKEIGAVLDVSESRVSQILTAIAGKLRTNMKVDRKT